MGYGTHTDSDTRPAEGIGGLEGDVYWKIPNDHRVPPSRPSSYLRQPAIQPLNSKPSATYIATFLYPNSTSIDVPRFV